ncbi:hypothetical protein VVT58_24300 (plasmid) [Sphingobium sp. SJ10-10]|uniref:hypothetical protein n=2 Tax=Sphingomonadaceae TaxID=41297 RepID=UPI000B57BD3A|nr:MULTISPECIES: hypothetical protein [unclassified Sphingobium]ART36157.1 B284 [uncultured bacterium]MEC6701339.1 hypothetical protein [Sphingobium sp. SJ10-10]PJG46397.1 hypothetical protein CAF53_19655 [Sphingobium sp. LB126]
MIDASRIAAAINLRVRQLEAQGITGIALADHMIGHMQDLHGIYGTASDRTLGDLCDRFPGFERYARIMEEMSERNQAMLASDNHPHGELPELPERLKAKLVHVLHAAAELERELQAAADGGHADHAGRLTEMMHRWADDLARLVSDFQSSDLPPASQALVQQVLKATAERIQTWMETP